MGVYYCWNYGPSKLLLHFIEYRLDQLNNKYTKIAVNLAIQYFEGRSQKKCLLKIWSFLVHPPQNSGPVKLLQNWTETIFLMANIFKLHEYQTFGLIKMHNMSKIWFTNDKFNLLWWNKKHFFMISQVLSVTRNSLRLETAPLTILTIKRGLLCNFAKKLVIILLKKAARVWNFQLLLNSKSSKLSLHSLLKNMSIIPNLGLKKRCFFSNFPLCSNCCHFSITRFDVLIFWNLLYLEMNFENLD